MASGTSMQHQRETTLAIRPSVEVDSENTPLFSDGMDIDDDHKSSSTHYEDDKTEATQIEQASRTPSPEPDSERYAAWGREHFGEEWYELRNTMLQERNIYMNPDPVYKDRQSALRMLERQVEGRTFMLSYTMEEGEASDLSAGTGIDSPSPLSLHDTDLSDSATDSPAPPSRGPTPLPSDPWARLEHHRKRLQWDALEHHIEAALLAEALLDASRSQREDRPGGAQRAAELARIRELPTGSWERCRQTKRFELRARGWSHEQIAAHEREECARWEAVKEQLRGLDQPTTAALGRAEEDAALEGMRVEYEVDEDSDGEYWCTLAMQPRAPVRDQPVGSCQEDDGC
ncbi:hypothetical protein F4781DRAFT_438927 [Annulohypoxylon bovei var. microspora]|nr:hypothetical protein F4781DRAFT_438927 [Annulohypoxylon bovei var. microspora]